MLDELLQRINARPFRWQFVVCGTAFWCFMLFIFSNMAGDTVIPHSFSLALFSQKGFLNVLGCIASLFLVAVTTRKKQLMRGNPFWVFLSCASLLIGLLMMLSQPVQTSFIACMVHFLIGFGQGIFLVLFSEMFTTMDLPQALFYVSLQMMIASPLAIIASKLLPGQVTLVILALLVALQGILFIRQEPGLYCIKQHVTEIPWNNNRQKYRAVMAVAVLTGVCFGVAALSASASGSSVGLYYGVSLLAAGLLLGYTSLRLALRWAEEFLYQMVLPLLTISLVSMPLLQSGINLTLTAAMICILYTNGILWFFSVLFHSESHLSLRWITSFIFLGLYIGQLIGEMLVQVTSFYMGSASLLVGLLICLIVLLLVIALSKYKRYMELLMDKSESYNLMYNCRMLAKKFALTAREEEILKLLANDLSTKQIAAELTLSENTVNTHIGNVYHKLKIHSRQELTGLLGEQVV